MTTIKHPLRVSLLAAAIGLSTLALCGNARAADSSGTATATSDYVFRGISQTLEDPALHVGVEVAFVPSIDIAMRPCIVDCDIAAASAECAATINF